MPGEVLVPWSLSWHSFMLPSEEERLQMPQQRRIRVKTSGSEEQEKKVEITVSDEDAERLDELDRWVSEKKKEKRKIDDVRFEPA